MRFRAAWRAGLAALVWLFSSRSLMEPPLRRTPPPVPRKVTVLEPPKIQVPHPPHTVRVWTARYGGYIFRTVQMPRCEHIEAVITYNRSGETGQTAKKRTGSIVAATASYHHPQTLSLADFLQQDGRILSAKRTGRWFFASFQGSPQIGGNYLLVRHKKGVDAAAMGSRLVPFHLDGFSKAFASQVTDRMAVGLSKTRIFVTQGKADLWKLSRFMQKDLRCRVAVNGDGGHVVRGKSPVHIVFRWHHAPPAKAFPRKRPRAKFGP
ncbi:MAG: hypothetical protein IT210_15185 [Armatimonadetes bacterium]|nr:hypothetical protein [Armatimonadota bacterium]